MRCKKENGTYTKVTWRMFYPNCPKVSPQHLCNAKAGAYVSAITVCTQRLF